MERAQKYYILKDLEKKMVLLVGPRQSGKTWLAQDIARSLLKEPKIYFFDTGLVPGDEEVRFENLVAVSLLKHVYGKIDVKPEDYGLYYLRTKEGQEVDFALVLEEQIDCIIEAKLSDATPGNSLVKFYKAYNHPAVQVVKSLRREYQQHGIPILDAHKFLSHLFL